MLRTNPCRCHPRPRLIDAVLEFRRGECARCGRFLAWMLAEVWEDGLGERALYTAVEDARLALRDAAREQGIDDESYVAWLESGAAESVNVIGWIKRKMKASLEVVA